MLPPMKVSPEAQVPSEELGFSDWMEMVDLALEQEEMPEEEQGREWVNFLTRLLYA